MPKQYCFLCASDDGVFLDVTSDNRSTFSDQLETCLSTKVNESIELSNKICYKCAYELDQCTKFVQKYKKSHSKPKAVTSCCYLCSEEGNCIFDITEDTHATFTPLQKIRNIFNEDFNKNNDIKLICLPCRYHLDVLYDLKRIYQETVTYLKALVNEEIDYSSFPKVYTDVVNRKTTISPFSDITVCGVIDTDSENSENMARGKRCVKSHKAKRDTQAKLQDVKPKIRCCDKCHNVVANDTDMYRFHRTGLTVCKNCWITMDPSKDKIKQGQRRSRQMKSNLAETKLCTVFLTDVMNEGSHKNEKTYESDGDKDKLYIISDSSPEEDISSGSSQPSVSFKPERGTAVNGKAKRGRKRRIDIEKNDGESIPSKITRSIKESVSTNEVKSSKVSSDAEQCAPQPKRRGRKRIAIIDRNSDSEISPSREAQKDIDTDKPLSILLKDIDKERKKLKSALEEVAMSMRSEPSDESSNEDGLSLKKRMKRSASNASTAHTSKESERSACSRTRSSSISSAENTSGEFKSPKSVAEITTEYTCDKCNKKFDSKLSRIEHKLTHLKQASLKLERITVKEKDVKEKQEIEVDTQEDEILKEEEAHSKIAIDVKCADDPSEDVAINIEDDTDDEDLLSMLKRRTETEASIEGNNVANQQNMIESKSPVSLRKSKKNSQKIQDDENVTKDSEYPISITLDETKSTLVQAEKDKEIIMLTDEDIDLPEEKDTDAEKAAEDCTNLNLEEDKDKDVEINESFDVSATEKEMSNEHNNEEEDLSEKIAHDSELDKLFDINTTKSNEDHSESCENDLKDDLGDERKDNEDDTTKDLEMKDSMIGFQEEDTEKPDEEDKIKSNTIDQMEILNVKKDFNDMIFMDEDEIDGSKQQDKIDDYTMENEIIVNIDNPNAKDTIKSDFSNGKKLDIVIDVDEDDNDISIFPIDSNNDIMKYKKITEETIAMNEPDEKDTLQKGIQDLEELIENNMMNNKCDALIENSVINNKCEISIENNVMNNKCEAQNSYHITDNSPTDAANEILREVFDLASAEVQKREDDYTTKSLHETEIETLENISREIRNSADMPSLDPISVMELVDNDITLN